MIKRSWLGLNQKNLWELLAKINPKFYIYSEKRFQSEGYFYISGVEDYNKYFKDLLKNYDGTDKVALEIGCGLGRLIPYFLTRFSQVIGVDISKPMISKATKKFSHISSVKFYQTNGNNLKPVKSSSIDLVYSYIVFQHMKSFDMVLSNLKDVKRVLNSDGQFIIQFRGRKPLRTNTWYAGVWFDKNSLQKILLDAGLKVDAIWITHDGKAIWARGKK